MSKIFQNWCAYFGNLGVTWGGWGLLGADWAFFGALWRVLKNIKKPLVFKVFSAVGLRRRRTLKLIFLNFSVGQGKWCAGRDGAK